MNLNMILSGVCVYLLLGGLRVAINAHVIAPIFYQVQTFKNFLWFCLFLITITIFWFWWGVEDIESLTSSEDPQEFDG